MKRCSKCKRNKFPSSFYKNRSHKDGLNAICSVCADKASRRYYRNNKEKLAEYKKVWHLKNIKKIKLKAKKWKQAHPNYDREYAVKNRDRIKARVRKNRLNKVEQYRKYARQYRKKKLKTDPNFRLRCNLRRRICKVIRGKTKSGSSVRDLGCSIEFLKKHLELKFKRGMSWSNYGNKWHIDHIIPLASFDLTDRVQFLEACHYTNLQPMWVLDNILKGAKISSCTLGI